MCSCLFRVLLQKCFENIKNIWVFPYLHSFYIVSPTLARAEDLKWVGGPSYVAQTAALDQKNTVGIAPDQLNVFGAECLLAAFLPWLSVDYLEDSRCRLRQGENSPKDTITSVNNLTNSLVMGLMSQLLCTFIFPNTIFTLFCSVFSTTWVTYTAQAVQLLSYIFFFFLHLRTETCWLNSFWLDRNVFMWKHSFL